MQAHETNLRQRRKEIADRAARSVQVQLRRGVRAGARELYYEAHSLLRALRQHLLGAGRAA